MAAVAGSDPDRTLPGRRTYVLDTSVLLADPTSVERFAEHVVVIPLVVLTELEAKRHHPELGWAARTVIRHLEDLRVAHGSITSCLPANPAGGTIRVEMNHQDPSLLPRGFDPETNDHRILAVAANLAAGGDDVVVVTKDLPLRLKASVAGLAAEEYRGELVPAEDWPGLVHVETDPATVDELYREREIDLDIARDLPCHAGIVLSGGTQSALGRVTATKRVQIVRGDRSLFDVRGRSAEQRLALDLLADDQIGIVSIGGNAGTGKSVLALAAGLDAVLEARSHKRIVVFRPLFAVGGQDLGFLPGTEEEKMNPWAAAVHDALESVCSQEVIDEVVDRQLLEVLPLTHIRGRNLSDSFIIIDEAQNLERSVLLTALTRLGENSRVVLTHDVAQRDNLRVGRHDGVAAVIGSLRGHPLFAHVTLTRSERSPVAALVADLLDSGR